MRLTPRAAVNRIDGVVDGTLAIRVTAAPVDGAANTALIRLVAAAVGVPRTRVALVVGASSRRKLIEIEGLEAATVRARWPGLDV
ncbi:MAG TPA: DUF167 domain-containing protein [Candidatus Limnocylindrales bacterium]